MIMTSGSAAWSSALMDTTLQTYYDDLNQQVEQSLRRPIIVAGVYHHAGVVSAMVVHKVSPLLALAMRRGAKKRANELPNQMLLALTTDHVVVFVANSHRGRVQPGEIFATWSRGDVRVVRAQDGAIFRRLVLQVGDSTIELDGTKDEVAHRIEAELAGR
jgi:hypothetical protein